MEFHGSFDNFMQGNLHEGDTMSTTKLTNCVQGTIGNVRPPGIPSSVKGTFVAHGENWAIHFQHVTGSSRIVNDRKSFILVCHIDLL